MPRPRYAESARFQLTHSIPNPAVDAFPIKQNNE